MVNLFENKRPRTTTLYCTNNNKHICVYIPILFKKEKKYIKHNNVL